MLTRPAAVLLIGSVMSGCSTGEDTAPRGDLDRLQGTWETMTGPQKDQKVVMVIKGDGAVSTLTTREDETITVRSRIRLDEQASPKAWDFTDNIWPGDKHDKDELAIYKLEGDTLTLCNGRSDRARPTEFEAGTDGVRVLKIYHRVRTADADGKPS